MQVVTYLRQDCDWIVRYRTDWWRVAASDISNVISFDLFHSVAFTITTFGTRPNGQPADSPGALPRHLWPAMSERAQRVSPCDRVRLRGGFGRVGDDHRRLEGASASAGDLRAIRHDL